MSQKLDNLLNLALETGETVREETQDLQLGYDPRKRTWELIVRYHGSLAALAALGVVVEELLAGYAILTVPEGLVEQVAALEQIEYVEKPKRYYYGRVTPAGSPVIDPAGNPAIDPAEEECVQLVTHREPYLTGEGVLIAVADSGIDYGAEVFRLRSGGSRIRFLWDQTLGEEFDRRDIEAALAIEDPGERFRQVPSLDAGGHGTAVAGIAAAVATGAELLIVKLGEADEDGFPRTTQIMRAVTYFLRKAQGLPLVINLSFGNSYGPHDGSALLERFLNDAAGIGRTVICVGAGNEGSSAGHLAGTIAAASGPVTTSGLTLTGGHVTGVAELAVGGYETNLSVQLWKNYGDEFRILLRAPGGTEQELPTGIVGRRGTGNRTTGKYILRMENTELLIYLGEPTPYSPAQEFYLEMLPVNGPYIDSGIWIFTLIPQHVVTGDYYFYLTDSVARNRNTGFLLPTAESTVTIPGWAEKVITVGAYRSDYDAYADFSGRGAVYGGYVKPDLVAPGVGVLAPDLFGGYTPMTGTSFAVPQVVGAAALLMEWGIVRGNDPYLYGEKIKAYLRAGARPLRGEASFPNNRVGFGALCVEGSLP